MQAGHKIEFHKNGPSNGDVYLDGAKLNRVVDFRVHQEGSFQLVTLVLDPSELHIMDKPRKAESAE